MLFIPEMNKNGPFFLFFYSDYGWYSQKSSKEFQKESITKVRPGLRGIKSCH